MSHKYLFIILTIALLTACSSDNNDKQENLIDKTPHEVAEKAVADIQDPLDKARNAASTIEEHNRKSREQGEGK